MEVRARFRKKRLWASTAAIVIAGVVAVGFIVTFTMNTRNGNKSPQNQTPPTTPTTLYENSTG
ncbi:MAG TPA: hypothetical protein VKM55_12350 [Candidatus Lokiarchaeia archaeon]|nr:hypothetical protein [Candidatus Lokiarchaeia archaeon]